jgi:hypothetical protein
MRLPSIACLIVISLGCTDGPSVLNRHLAREFGSLDFSSRSWKAGDREARGNMVASLMQSHRADMTTSDKVFGLLGPSECYVNYDDEPCYLLTNRNKTYRLEFSVNHSTHPGRILGASLGEAEPAVRSMTVRSVPVPANTR